VPRALRLTLQAGAIVLLALLIGLFAKTLIDNETTVAARVKDGQTPPAPDFTLDRLDGSGTFSLDETRGTIVVLNFWASWCGPCQDEAPVLNEIARRYAGDVTVVGVDTTDPVSDGRAFAERYGLSFPLVHDQGGLGQDWGLTGLPETFLIAPDGDVVRHFPGAIDGSELTAGVDDLLGTG
jgi:cytochrome c biogenesis protein CcmG/thiol:disulfide interchange protein DsbE